MPKSFTGPSPETEIEAVKVFVSDVSDDDLLVFLKTLPMAWSDTDRMKLSDFIYEALLWPYVKHAWNVVQGQPGLAGRLKQLSDVYALAEKQMELDTGRRRRIPRVTNLALFLDAYQRGALQPA